MARPFNPGIREERVHPRSVANAAVNERVEFLKRVYGWMAAALALSAVGTWLSIVSGAATALLQAGLIAHFLVWGAWIAMGVVAQKVRHQPVVGVGAFVLYSMFTGLVISDIVLFAMLFAAATTGSAWTYVAQAFGLTSAVFGGLSVYAITTKRDFSWMGGMLVAGTIALIGVGIIAMIVGMSSAFSLGFSFVAVLLFSGWVLYNTQQIMRTYPTNEHLAAAMHLFTDFAVLFMHILNILLTLASGGD